MILIRYILIGLVIYLFVRSFVRYFEGEPSDSNHKSTNQNSRSKERGVSKDVGEFVDYEEVDD